MHTRSKALLQGVDCHREAMVSTTVRSSFAISRSASSKGRAFSAPTWVRIPRPELNTKSRRGEGRSESKNTNDSQRPVHETIPS